MFAAASDQQINHITPDKPTSFLSSLAYRLLQKYGTDMSAAVVVLPNLRGGSYLKDSLREALAGKPALLPTIISMDELVRQLVPERVVDGLEAQMILFQSFRAIRNETESFETFFPIGQILFSDFEEITRHGKPISLIYRNLAEWEATGINFSDFLTDEQKEVLEQFWSHFQGDKMSALKQRFLSLWRVLPLIFEDFTSKLVESQSVTSAMAYARSASHVRHNEWLQTKETVWFAGFGEVTESEKQLIAALQAQNKAELVWDFNPLFSGNPVHEVSRLISRLQKDPLFQDGIEKTLQATPQSAGPVVQIVQCQGLVGMTHWLRENALVKTDAPKAFILTDPALVQLLVQQGDFDQEGYNFTMGFPLAYSGAVAWIHRLLAWAERERKEELDLLSVVIHHPLGKRMLPVVAEQWTAFFSIPLLSPLSLERIRQILPETPVWFWSESALEWIQQFNFWWKNLKVDANSTDYEQSTYTKIGEVLADLESLVSMLQPEQVNWKVIRLLLVPVLYRHSIGIKGNTGSGIQVLGLYETRVLDFDEVVVAPAEEGKVPTGGSSQSFLTENVRKAFGLPTRTQRLEDELYQFYRLCFRSSKISLLVDQSPDAKPSRLLNQIRYSGLFRVDEIQQQYGHSLPVPQEIRIRKDENVQKWVSRYFQNSERKEEKALSPSFLHSLLVCPLRTHYSYFGELKAPEEDAGLEMSPADFGNWVHGTIQALYLKQQTGKSMTVEDYEAMKAAWATEQYSTWKTLPNKLAVRELDHYLIEKEAGKIMAFRFFDFMSEQKPHIWKANEQVLQRHYIQTAGLPDLKWAIEGRADLVLETDTEHWIIDLKTGSFLLDKAYEINVNKLGSLEKTCRANKEVFQMLIYNWLNSKAFDDKRTRTYLFHMANPEAKLIDPLQAISSNEGRTTVLQALEEVVGNLLDKLVDQDLLIAQTTDMESCTYCDFKAICQR